MYCQYVKTTESVLHSSNDLEFQKSLVISKNVSKILDKLLKGYDKRLRPNYGGNFKKA